MKPLKIPCFQGWVLSILEKFNVFVKVFDTVLKSNDLDPNWILDKAEFDNLTVNSKVPLIFLLLEPHELNSIVYKPDSSSKLVEATSKWPLDVRKVKGFGPTNSFGIVNWTIELEEIEPWLTNVTATLNQSYK